MSLSSLYAPCFQHYRLTVIIDYFKIMTELVVNIQVEAFPLKKQDRSILRLQLDPDTSIEEIIEYLISEGKVKLDLEEIVISRGSEEVSKKMLITDLDNKNGATLDLKLKRMQSKSKAPPSQTRLPRASTYTQEKSQFNFFQSSDMVNSPPPLQKSQNSSKPPASMYPTQRITNTSFKKEEIKEPPTSQKYSIIGSQTTTKSQFPTPPAVFKNETGLSTKEGSISSERKDDIEFKVEYRQGGCVREFQYSSRLANAKSECLDVTQSKSMVQIVIVDNNRRIKFEVQKI